MTFRRIVRMDPEPEALTYACMCHVGETTDGLVQCGKPGEVWLVIRNKGRFQDWFLCPGCYEKFREDSPQAPALESIPFIY